jgi:pimeloyl-ACP methyl ester carboxylesterase
VPQLSALAAGATTPDRAIYAPVVNARRSRVVDGSMLLADGRTLAYTDAGAPGGLPIFYFHGAPGGRLEVAWMEEAFAAAGVRVLSADRPGYGGSSPSPRRSMSDWPWDVAALAHHLSIDRFAVMGFSSGGPYVAACAALLGIGVVAAASVAGITDMGWSAAYDEFPDGDEKTIMQIDDEDRARAWCEDHYGADGARFFDHPLHLSPPDSALFADEAFVAARMPTFAEAFRQGVGGVAQDITVQGRAWPFNVANITCGLRVYHGDQDTLVPVGHGRHTAEIIEGSTLVVLPEHGHISMLTEIPRISTDLAGTF